VPSSETTSTSGVGWISGSFYKFAANTANTVGGNLSGRKYREYDYATAIDNCWQSGDPTEYHVTGSAGSIWTLNSSNYYEDTVGRSTAEITYYRVHGRAPCTVQVFQRMQMSCGDATTYAPYSTVQSQVLEYEIGTTTIKASRGSVVHGPITYP
jgi:hypothetical protein